MASQTYSSALARLLQHEGGYTHHPADPGGPTNFGITIADYRKYVKPGASAADVKAMTAAEAKRIYRAKYWDAQRCDELPAGVDYAVFDYGVNSGIGRSGKVLRRCLGMADDSSIVTDAVIAAAHRTDAKALVAVICDDRLRFLQRLKTWPVFGKGWGRRVAEVRAHALVLTDGAARSKRVISTPGKGAVPMAKGAQQGSAGAVVAAGAATATRAHESGASVATVIIIIVIAVACAMGGWMFWQWRQRQQQQKPA